MKENQRSRIIGLVGQRDSGKTSLILELLQKLQTQNLQIAGIISPGIFEGEQKVAIEMIDLVSRQGRLLAVLRDENETGLQFGDWSFFEETLDWANQKFESVSTCEVLIFDEVGPLELDFKKGVQQGLAKMVAGKYKMGIISLRPKCADAVQALLPGIELFLLDILTPEAIKETVFRIATDHTMRS